MQYDQDELRNRYRRDGYLVVEDFLPATLVDDLRRTTRDFVRQARAGLLSDQRFDIIARPGADQALRRITDPDRVAPIYDQIMRYGPLVDLVAHLLGGTVRFDHAKLNFKPPGGGGAVEWHQDWAYYPMTNDDMLAVGVMIEDCTLDNGPLMVIPGSHTGTVYDHHQRGRFVGGIPVAALGETPIRAVALTAPAGSISVHHVRTVHGSGENRGIHPRPLLLYNYVAVDAFPVFHSYDWDAYNARILRGEATCVARVAPVPIRVPQPAPIPSNGYSSESLFSLQQGMEER